MRLLYATALTLAVAACSGGGGEPTQILNAAPVVSTGTAPTTTEGSQVEVTATASDPNGDSFTILWTQVSGPPIVIEDADTLTPTFIAPNVNETEEITLEITVTDSNGLSTSRRITVTIDDTGRIGPSPQGIPDDSDDRRGRARGNREGRDFVDSREVRTYDGTNNNIANPTWGATFEHLQRLGDADYSDGISSLAGASRPSARAVSNGVSDQPEGTSIPNTVQGTDFVWQWGQFLDHDLDLTDGAEESADILVPAGDPLFDPSNSGTAVITFNRALYDLSTGTDASNPREQENEITSWIDGSMVYGSDDARNAAIREAGTPFLRMSSGNLLPFNTGSLTNANGFVTDPTTLFLAGDIRANEQLGLTVMHTLFAREHNRLAEILETQNPGKDADAIYEQARRLVIAKIQYITYNEWLPMLVGSGAIPAYSGYDDSLNPTIFNEFSVAAFRLGHSMLNEQLLRLDAAGDEIAEGHVDLKAAFFTGPSILTSETDLDPILRGLATQLHQQIDAKVIDDVRNFLFGQPGSGGLDLASLNIQRGRDHGVPSYNDMREAMGLSRVTQFGQISSDNDVAEALFDTYGDVNEIDLWVGGLAEDPVSGSQLGELFQAIIVRQFTYVRDADRFWWENHLTTDEQNDIRNSSLADIIRDNTSIRGGEIQDNVFVAP